VRRAQTTARDAGGLPIIVSEEVASALTAGRSVVALESTLITHGFAHPQNLEVARRSEAAVRAGGAVPATVAVGEGLLRVGLTDGQLERLATLKSPGKATRQNLAALLAGGGWAGTTVSATMIAAHLAGIRVFATGGIGGVHRGAAATMDISADLQELARTPVAVVCAGPKSILDVPLTMEVLETLGVPVIGFGTDELPGFLTRSSGIPLSTRVDDAPAAARLLRTHWALGLGGALVCVAPPASHALDPAEHERALARALADAEEQGITGPRSTPFLLARIAELTEGRSVAANAALIEHDSAAATRLAVALIGTPRPEERP